MKLVWVVVGVVVVLGIVAMLMGAGNRTSGEDARALVANGALLLDVRTPGEFNGGHIEGAKNVPVDELEKRLAELGDARPVVVYCRSGMRSARAAKILRSKGWQEVHDLGSISRW